MRRKPTKPIVVSAVAVAAMLGIQSVGASPPAADGGGSNTTGAPAGALQKIDFGIDNALQKIEAISLRFQDDTLDKVDRVAWFKLQQLLGVGTILNKAN